MIRKYNLHKFLFIVLIFFIVTLDKTEAQSTNKIQFADSISTVLQKKLLLNNEQTSEIKDLVLNYLENKKQNINELDKKVFGLLNTKQKAKYNIIKNEWLGIIDKENKIG